MRQTGTLTDWKDDKGFGFITPIGVGTKLFVHVSEFERESRRPAVGDRVDYRVDPGSGKGPRARQVRFADAAAVTPPRRARLRMATLVAMCFLAWLVFAIAAKRLNVYVLVAYLVASATSFGFYAIDKSAARDARRRVPEETLHAIDLAGGWPGGALAQQWLRHKSSKRSFAVGYWMSVVVNIMAAALALTAAGHATIARLADLLR